MDVYWDKDGDPDKQPGGTLTVAWLNLDLTKPEDHNTTQQEVQNTTPK